MSFHLCFRLPDGYRVTFSDGSFVDFEAPDPAEAFEMVGAIHDAKYLKPPRVICLPGN